jgi:hypothetical protein
VSILTVKILPDPSLAGNFVDVSNLDARPSNLVEGFNENDCRNGVNIIGLFQLVEATWKSGTYYGISNGIVERKILPVLWVRKSLCTTPICKVYIGGADRLRLLEALQVKFADVHGSQNVCYVAFKAVVLADEHAEVYDE